MKKVLPLFSLLFVTGFFVLVTPHAFAAATTPLTEVTGIVTDTNNNPDNGVSVSATCNGITHSTTSGTNGKYQILFSESDDCTTADTVTVNGNKSSGSGSGSGGGSGQVHHLGNFDGITVNFSVINFSVPEFTTMLGLVAGIASLGGYLALRKRSV